jgi:hypothetical protein
VSYSIDGLINAIDEHPLRWEEITLESVISLPTLRVQSGEKLVDFFFYSIGGPVTDRKIWPPYYRVSGSASPPYNVDYQPIELGAEDESLGSYSSSISRSERDIRLQQLYTITSDLIDIYPKKLEETSDTERGVIKEFKKLFDLLAHPPVLSVYRMLNPHFFEWLASFS